MRRRRGDVRIAAGGGQPLGGDRRRVVAVYQIVRDARVLRILCKLLLENSRRFEVCSVALIGLGLSTGEIKRRKDLRFVVVAVAGGQFFECLRARFLPRALGTVRVILIVGRNRLDVIAFALGFSAEIAPVIDGGLRLFGALRLCAGARQRIRH